MVSSALRERLERIDQKMRVLEDHFIPKEERIGLDRIRGPEDLAISMRFMLDVYVEGKTEAVWAAENPREYERLSEIAGLVPGDRSSQPTRR